MDKFIVVGNYCGWPNITKKENGEILMAIYNQPVHALWEGEVECFVSSDVGMTWKYRGTPVCHAKGKNRMNTACGNAHNGDYIAIVSGWDCRLPPNSKEKIDYSNSNILESVVCRSIDNGKTFKKAALDYIPKNEKTNILPYGNIIQLPGKRLMCPFLSYRLHEHPITGSAYVLFSEDDGYTWGDARVVAEERFNEIAILLANDNKILAAVRTLNMGSRLELFESNDLGNSWHHVEVLTAGGMHPANLLLLQSGAILLTYGIRFKRFYGVGCMLSEDNGKSWGVPFVLTEFEGATDGGYPSSIEGENGSIVTAYYANNCKNHNRYHVGIIKWRLEEFFAT